MTVATIARIETWAYRVPLSQTVETSFGIMRDRPAVFVRIEDDQGVFGWGEIFANWPAAGAEHRARLVLEDIAHLLLGENARRPEAAFQELTRETHIRALQCGEFGPFAQAIAGIDGALWDLCARAEGKSLRGYLNSNAPDIIPAYASGIDCRKEEAVVDAARDDGHVAFKLKVGFDDQDADHVARHAAGLGPGETLYLDANQAWSADQASKFLTDIEGIPVGWLEEPIPADAPEQSWLDLRERSKILLAGGENIVGLDAFRSVIETGIFGFIQPDVAKWGGVSGCYRVGQMAVEAGLTYCPHFLGGGIGLLASANLLAAVGGEGSLEVDVNSNPLRDAFSIPSMQNGTMALSTAPGLGVETLPETIDRYKTFHSEVSV
ncbi:MAG: mandelate racemase/muconate lactonizing enzyme family protein [Hyphomicrobiales bacterium]